MQSTFDMPFIQGRSSVEPLPLGRFLPLLPGGILTAWLRENTSIQQGSWLLDPLGSTPALALEAGRAGYRVLVACNNPVLALMLEILAGAPQPDDFQAAISELALMKRGEERLDTHLQSLYTTECAVCGNSIPSQGYLWKRGEAQPYAVIYRCPHCKDEGERPMRPVDLEQLSLRGSKALHQARALERISAGDAELRQGALDAFQLAYLPRAIYFLFTLINKIESLGANERRRKLLLALALSVLDEGTTLWPWPSLRTRPRQLTTPPQFRENNLWQSLENAVALWSSQPSAVPLTRWPELPPESGGICLYPGRLKSILPLSQEFNFRAALTVIPRPNQAFWTLSALWSGWLWGSEAASLLKSALERQRYDWHWHTTALFSAFGALHRVLPVDTPFFALLPELAPGFLAASLIASSASGWGLKSLALRSDQEMAQFLWQKQAAVKPGGARPMAESVQYAMKAHLQQVYQPEPYLPLYAAAMTGLVQENAFSEGAEALKTENLNRIQAAVAQTFSAPGFLRRFQSQSQDSEAGWWWFCQPPEASEAPLFDRVEMETVRFLQNHAAASRYEIDEQICRLFPGLSTPTAAWIDTCLDSYGEQVGSGPDQWKLKESDSPAARKADVQAARQMLALMAKRFGFQVYGDAPLVWKDATGKIVFQFYVLASSFVSRYVNHPQPVPVDRCVIVLPGSRANLLANKFKLNPALAEACQGWHFVKFRYLRQLAGRNDLTLEMWTRLLDEDPLLRETPLQMEMF